MAAKKEVKEEEKQINLPYIPCLESREYIELWYTRNIVSSMNPFNYYIQAE